MKKNLFSCLLWAFMAVMTVSCGDDDEPSPTPSEPSTNENSLTYKFSKSYSWAAAEFTDVTLVEIHSDVEDYKLSYEAPQGYRLYLKKEQQKDRVGFTVYRIVCDMDPVTAVTENNKNEIVEIEYSISGNGYRDGKPAIIKYEDDVEFQRFDCPKADLSALYKGWYLAEHDVKDNSDWVEFQTKYKFSEIKKEPIEYSETFSPLTISSEAEYYNKDGVWTLHHLLSSSCNTELPGWKKNNDVEMGDSLIDNGRFGISGEPRDFGCAVYFVNGNMLRCMKGEYSNGELVRIHYYKFIPRSTED